jgi:hypothetical protein
VAAPSGDRPAQPAAPTPAIDCGLRVVVERNDAEAGQPSGDPAASDSREEGSPGFRLTEPLRQLIEPIAVHVDTSSRSSGPSDRERWPYLTTCRDIGK